MSISVKKFAGSPTTGESLLRGIRATDQDSWRRLVDIYSPLVLHWLIRSGVRGANAADVAQEVFAAVFLGISTFDHVGAGSFRGWLWGISRNKICDHYRRQRRDLSLDDLRQLESADAPSVNGDGDQEAKALEPLYDALESVRAVCENRTWQAFYGVFLEGRPPADIARELHMTVGAVYIAKSRVLSRLRDAMKET